MKEMKQKLSYLLVRNESSHISYYSTVSFLKKSTTFFYFFKNKEKLLAIAKKMSLKNPKTLRKC